jgi:hypothetical protein
LRAETLVIALSGSCLFAQWSRERTLGATNATKYFVRIQRLFAGETGC